MDWIQSLLLLINGLLLGHEYSHIFSIIVVCLGGVGFLGCFCLVFWVLFFFWGGGDLLL